MTTGAKSLDIDTMDGTCDRAGARARTREDTEATADTDANATATS